MGVDGGYTEDDVKQAAKLLSGMQVEWATKAVAFNPKRHYVGAIKVMSFSHPNDSAEQGATAAREFYEYLAFHPSTAKHLATKLARRFVSDEPSAALISNLASVYLNNDTQIVPVLKALFASEEFLKSSGLKLRRPMEHLAAVTRVAGVKHGNSQQALFDFVWALNGSGHLPLSQVTPDGYPDTAADWQAAGKALTQYSMSRALVNGYWPEKLTYPGVLTLIDSSETAVTPEVLSDQVCTRVFGRTATALEKSAITTLLSGPNAKSPLKVGSTQQTAAISAVTVLLMQSPAFLTR